MGSLVTLRGVTFELSNGRTLFTDLNLSLGGNLSALVGPNGVGKTCLAHLLAGDLAPSAGSIRRSGPITYFRQRLAPPPVSVADLLADAWSLVSERLLAGIDRQALCTTLSGGEWMRVRLARALDDHYLILDEPTNDLDRNGREAVLQFLREHTGGALLISHDRECLALCEDILELSSHGIAKFGDGWQAYTEAKAQARAALQGALDRAKREREVAREERHAQQLRQDKRNRRGADAAARGGLPKILLGGRKSNAQASTGKVDAATFERLNAAVRETHDALSALKVDPVMYADLVGGELHAQQLVAEARAFNVRFGEWLYAQDLTFTWRGNVRIAIKGGNGAGKSTLVRALLGAHLATRGELRRGDLATLYIDQRCALLDDDKSVLDNIRAVATGSESELRTGLARFLFAKDTVFQRVDELSGGERLRAALARGFLSTRKPELLILDEPTNNLDLGNVAFLEGLVREFRGALAVISHDEVFLDACRVEETLILRTNTNQSNTSGRSDQ